MQDKSGAPPARRAVIGLIVVLLLGGLMAAAGGSTGLRFYGLPAFAVAAALAFALQWLAFVPAYLAQSERYYDLVGSLTYLSVTMFALWLSSGPRVGLLGGLVAVWASRLGTFLYRRIRETGSDQRFDRIKPFFWPFLMTWSLQGLWVVMTAAAALAAMTSGRAPQLDIFAGVGASLWLIGFVIEVMADQQKRAFRRDPANKGRFISTGLWAWSQHPNYFGEILLWTGVAIIAWPALSGWQYLTLVSPVFVFVLLTRVSGIPLLAAQGRKRWGDDPDYQNYLQRTSLLVPRPPRSKCGF